MWISLKMPNPFLNVTFDTRKIETVLLLGLNSHFTDFLEIVYLSLDVSLTHLL
jgi:hypothetical protein